MIPRAAYPARRQNPGNERLTHVIEAGYRLSHGAPKEHEGVHPVMTAHAAEPTPVVPPMPERNPKALRAAIAQHAPQLLPNFDEHWKWAVADAYDISTVPAFMARWWGEFAIARDPKLDAHMANLHHRAAESTDIAEAKALMEEASHIRHEVQRLEPGQ
ncbi:hypothetical protein ACVW19_002769 [Streptomyces sp. TE5632]